MMLGGKGIGLGLRGQATNAVGLQAGMSYVIPPGNFFATPGPYTHLQWLDPVTGIWRNFGADGNNVPQLIASDGANYRLANMTGCPVGAIITTGLATGATTGIGATATNLTVTPSSGASTWSPIVGGAISLTCVTGVTAATGITADTIGAGYLYPPTVVISAPPSGGLQATAHVTGIPTTAALLATQVIIDNQGAGYNLKSTGFADATITFVNDPRDTVGHGAVVRLGLTGTGILTGLYPLNSGVPLTGAPTFSFSVGAAAATAIMDFVVTSFTTGMTGVLFSTGSSVPLISGPNTHSATPLFTNPIHDKNTTFPRPARLLASLSSGAITIATTVIEDAGSGLQVAPNLNPIGILSVTSTGIVSGMVQLVATVGGVADTSWLQPV